MSRILKRLNGEDVKISVEQIINDLDLTSPGYITLPGGLIIQWGLFTGTGITNFPIPFPNACLIVLSDGMWAINSNPPYKTLSAVENWTKTGFTRGTFGLIQTGNFNEALATHSYRTISAIANFGGQSRWIAIGH